MNYEKLYIWVEGDDDKEFFERLIKPIFEKRYDYIAVIQYAQKKSEWKENFLKNINRMNADYIYAADINNAACVTAKKQKIQEKLKNIDENRIIVVIKEIESWYLAGLDDINAKKLKIPTHVSTDTITKEQFNGLIPNKFERIDVMSEILKCFSLEIARQKNVSFNYFVEKYSLKECSKTED
ncbi:MAG: DUF4276 family protein [bacterium]|nr:DUF4276 family protein [bacterium]